MTTTQRPPHRAPIPCSVWFGPVVSPVEERKLIDQLVAKRGVGVCCWPRDAERVEHLAAARIPRLLLVRPDSVPPALAPQQAWVDSSASIEEIHDALVALCSWPPPAAARRRSA